MSDKYLTNESLINHNDLINNGTHSHSEIDTFINTVDGNYVDLTTNQTVGGAKTFTSLAAFNGNISIDSPGFGSFLTLGSGLANVFGTFRFHLPPRMTQILNP
ncbi:MAG TPA: hypothetical protein PLS50_04635, partial [Candidatus Dojkabacteria bacterium]|nr:hypothetical protein [Candidatus Dojkabacteria bacterium]